MTQEIKNLSSPAQTQRGYPGIGTKYYKILEHFRLGGSINKFEAQHLGENCLGTTVGAMCGDFNLEVTRVFEKAKNTIGAYSRVIRYKLTKQDIMKLNTVKLRGSDE
jgi:hypothetical protein